MTTNSILLIILAIGISVAVAYFQYFFKAKKHTNESRLLAFLRFLTVFGLLVLLINPQVNTTEFSIVKPKLNVLVDNSTSIQYSGEANRVKNTVSSFESNNSLNQKFDLNLFHFSDDLLQNDSLTFTTSETNIHQALSKMDELLDEETNALTVLVTDGNQTHGPDYIFFNPKQPIYPIVVGDTLTYEDLQISQINVNSYASLNNQFPVEVFVQYDGNSAVNKTFSISSKGRVVYSTSLSLSATNDAAQFEFFLPANTIGTGHYKAQIGFLDDEKNKVNNSENFSVEVIDEQAKILLLSSIKHPDIGMLKRSIETNRLLKVTLEEDLNKKINTKDYQLVILYQPNAQFKSIFDEVITNKTNLFLISGAATNWDFLNEAQPFFKKSNRAGTEDFGALFNTDFDEFIIQDIEFENFAPLKGHFGEIEFKGPGKSILYQRIANYDTQNPLLSTLAIGNQRVAALFGEGIWKWRMLSTVSNDNTNEFDDFLQKIIQYLSSSKRANRLELAYKKINFANSDVQLNAHFYDANYTFDPGASIKINYTNRSTNEGQEIPFSLKNNTYEVLLSNLKPGIYDFLVSVKNNSYKKSGSFTVLDYDVEQQLTSANINHLNTLAKQSGGNVFTLDETNELMEELINDKSFVSLQKSSSTLKSLIDLKWLMGILAALLSLEWFIRKYRGLI